MKRILSEKERRVIVAAQLKANASISKLQEETGYPAHVVRHSLKRLVDGGILSPYTLINIAPLGFDKVAVFFSLSTTDVSVRNKSIDYVKSLRCVVSVSELVGDCEYFMSIACRSSSELAVILGQISEAVGCFRQHAICTRSALILYQRTYLAKLATSREYIAYHMGGQRLELGSEYLSVLAAVDACGTCAPATIARKTGQPISSVAYRLTRLEQERIIAGHLFGVRAGAFGVSMHDIMISTQSSGPRLGERMHSFCLNEPNVVGLACCLGSWQFELRVEVEDSRELMALCNRIKATFGDEVMSLRTHTMVRELKYMKLPFDAPQGHPQSRKVA